MPCALSQPVPQSPAHGKSSQLVDEDKMELNTQTINQRYWDFTLHTRRYARLAETPTVNLPTFIQGLFPAFTLSGFLGITCVVYLFPVCHLSATWQTGADYLLRVRYVLGTKDMTSGTKVSAFTELIRREAMCR